MGQITSGTGLVSGIDIAGLIDQLIALETRPRQLVEQRNKVLTAQQTALQDVNSKLLGLKFNVDSLTGSSPYNATTASTSNENVLTVSSGAGAIPGNYSFTVDKLVSSQQVLTKGFRDSNSSPVGSGTLTFEKGNARLDSKTRLSDLNGGAGVERGLIRVTDRSGAVGLIDLSRAVTVDDAILAINSATNVSVRATVTGDGLTISDNTGLGAGDLIITNAGLSNTASSLGIAGTSATGQITGTSINTLGEDTLLSYVNDGQGVDIRDDLTAEFSITDGAGTSFNVNLLNETTIGEVIDTINAASAAAGAGVTAAIAADGVSLELTDSTGGGATFAVAANGTRTAASDLGLLGADDDADGVISGARIIAGINSRLVSKLNGGQALAGDLSLLTTDTPLDDLFDGAGLTTTNNVLNEMIITARNNNSKAFNFDAYTTAGDLINAVNTAFAGDITMSISGNAFVITDNTGGAFNLRVSQPAASAVGELGLLINAAVNSVTGVDTSPVEQSISEIGSISITDGDGTNFTVDLSTAESVSDILTLIDDASTAAGANVTASLNRAGNGILLSDSSAGAGGLVIADVDRATAAALGISGTFTDGEADSGNLQYRYITEGTSLSSFGFVPGSFRITDSTGKSATVNLNQGERTIAEVLADINSRGLAINARINDTGDGILIEDTNAGVQSVAIKVEESGSSTAASLGILGEASAAGQDLDGSFEKTVDFTSDVMTGATLLSALNAGNGIDYNAGGADFEVTTQDGNTFQVDITAGILTVDDLINTIETASGNTVTVEINEAGTALTFTDNTGGAGTLSFEALDNSEALSDLKFKDDEDGQFTTSALVQVTTLQDLAELINESGVGVSAAIINDGSQGTPYRLILSSDNPGSAGAFVFDDGGAGFRASTFSEAQDAVIFYGSSNPAQAQVITSTSNTLEDVIPGTTVNLLSTSDTPVQVTVAQDDQAATAAAQAFVDGFNNLMTTIDKYDKYDAETEERGLLLGDSALVQLKSRLYSAIISRSADLSGSYSSLSQVGISVGSGGTLRLDSAKFQNALATDREAVENLFTFKTTETDDDGQTVTTARGVGVAIDELLERLTDTDTGIIESRVASIDSQINLNQDRIDDLNEALERKRARLEAEFFAMETALASLQSQSTALSSLQQLSAQGARSISNLNVG